MGLHFPQTLINGTIWHQDLRTWVHPLLWFLLPALYFIFLWAVDSVASVAKSRCSLPGPFAGGWRLRTRMWANFTLEQERRKRKMAEICLWGVAQMGKQMEAFGTDAEWKQEWRSVFPKAFLLWLHRSSLSRRGVMIFLILLILGGSAEHLRPISPQEGPSWPSRHISI